MKPLAATLIFVFAAFHGAAVAPWVMLPRDPSAKEDSLILRVPQWARLSWASAALLTAVGAIVFALDGWLGFAIAAFGMAEICGFAVANGFWMRGRPTIAHHVIRIAIAAAILALAAFSLLN
jgi:hypothetical protein